MNATQSKALIQAAHNAMTLLPSSQERAALRRALNALATASAPVRAKSAKISKKAQPYKPIIGTPNHSLLPRQIKPETEFQRHAKSCNLPWRSSEIKPDPACQCAGCQILDGFRSRGLNAPVMIERNEEIDAQFQAMQDLAVASKFCVCGHLADEHEKDEMENLLKCTRKVWKVWEDQSRSYGICGCDHFHCDVDQLKDVLGADEEEQDAA